MLDRGEELDLRLTRCCNCRSGSFGYRPRLRRSRRDDFKVKSGIFQTALPSALRLSSSGRNFRKPCGTQALRGASIEDQREQLWRLVA
jgi:hypothetical protein